MEDMAGALREARLRAGVSLTAMAARTHFSKGHLSNVEAGRRTATADVVLAYIRVLGEDAVNRRQLLTGAAAGVLTPLVAPVVAADLIREGFSAALDGAGRTADEWEQRVHEYGRDYMSLAGNRLQQSLAADLVVLQQQLETPRMWAAAARLLAVYGKTIADADEAIGWYRLAATAADRSGDEQARVWVRGRAALALAYEGARPPIAMRMAEQALALSGRPSLGRLNALVAKAHTHALLGQPAAARQADAAAQRLFDRVGSRAADEQISDFAVPEWRMATFRSMLLARLGDPAAVRAQETADRTRPAELTRFATHIELHRALMLSRSGDRSSGVRHARQALAALPAERHTLSLRLMLAEIERT